MLFAHLKRILNPTLYVYEAQTVFVTIASSRPPLRTSARLPN
jgi:hypothetical protein